ncbi:CBS domain-containing protein [Frateuria terrea]|uniref:CBS domain-containing protein n=1 Tax=Frateuria terrea TaxID=529704 RepID=A0A1H6UNQ1_9GAMM|nr:CBS domain-containing protein [Frateuria terrea]SEI93891.1 CBS domain-containing protein [Frateuria terrea]SFP34454.1 CBS domain-containing protein [Frateuria terrea]
MQVHKLCTHQVVSVSPAASVTEAARLMRQRHVGMLVVVEQPNGERIPVGVLTDRDIVIQVVAPEVPCAQLRVDEVMTRDPATCSHDELLLDAVARMRTHGVRRLPVLNAKGGLCGLLSLDDIYGALGVYLQEMSRALVRGQVREMEARP